MFYKKFTLALTILCSCAFLQAQNPPKGRVAVVADGNFRDSDDIAGTPVSLAILRAFGNHEKLVHYSHSCDLRKAPGDSDPPGNIRQIDMQLSCDGTASRWGGFDHITFYNCQTQKSATINDLRDHINASTSSDPLWIIEAGEPDIIWEAMNKAQSNKRDLVYIVTHHPNNDRGDDYNLEKDGRLGNITDLGFPKANIRRIPNQNTLLKKPLNTWHWARDHSDTRIKWLWDRGYRAQLALQEYGGIRGDMDPSDAGMLYYWCTLDQPGGGDQYCDVPKLRTLLTNYVAGNGGGSCSGVTLDATDDFNDLNVNGFVPAYKDNARDAVAVNSIDYPTEWAAARTTFTGQTGTYDVALTTLTEIDGESSYRVRIGGELVGTYKNPTSTEDYKPSVKTWTNVAIENGEVIQVECQAHTNGLIPENGGTAYARGRWRQIQFVCKGTAPITGPEGFVFASNESETINISGKPYDIAYGHDGAYVYLENQTNDVSCSNATFGTDPLPNVKKYCFVKESKVPYLGAPIAIPGTLEAEHFDFGGAGVSYTDSDNDNKGASESNFRIEDGVDIGSGNGGNVVGWTSDNEWLEYTVDVEESANYEFNFYVSSKNGGGVLRMEIDGSNLMSGIEVPQTNDWDTYMSFKESVNLEAGEHTLRLYIENRGFNLDKVEIMKKVTTSVLGENESRLEVFPNPSDGVFHLSEAVDWSVYNGLGEMVLNGEGNTVNLSTYRKGFYSIKTNFDVFKITLK